MAAKAIATHNLITIVNTGVLDLTLPPLRNIGCRAAGASLALSNGIIPKLRGLHRGPVSGPGKLMFTGLSGAEATKHLAEPTTWRSITSSECGRAFGAGRWLN